MKARILLSILLVLAGLAILPIPVAAAVPPGGTGYVTFTCNVDGAQVYIDGNYAGTISGYQYFSKFTSVNFGKSSILSTSDQPNGRRTETNCSVENLHDEKL